MKPCDAQKPCQNSGNCTDDIRLPDKYFCECPPDFTGKLCETKVGPCKPNSCLHDGMSAILKHTSIHIFGLL
jgi:hypothetical protein